MNKFTTHRSTTSFRKSRKQNMLENPLQNQLIRKPYTSEKISRSKQQLSIQGLQRRKSNSRLQNVDDKKKEDSGSSGSLLIRKRGQQKSSKKPQSSLLTHRSSKPIPQQIADYLKKKQDVQIVKYFQEYKKQFYTKSKILHEYIYKSDEPEKIKNTYLNETDSHYRNGLEACMLKLFREGVIVPKSYQNLRYEAVEEIQKWVLGWIHRKISYGQKVEDEENQIYCVECVVKEIQDFKRKLDVEDTQF